MPYKHVRLNDPLSRPLISNDDRFIFLTRIVYWLGYWQSLPEKDPLEHHFGLYRTSALRELLFTLYLYSGLQPSVWGESYLWHWKFKKLSFTLKYLSHDIGINNLRIAYPIIISRTVETTLLAFNFEVCLLFPSCNKQQYLIIVLLTMMLYSEYQRTRLRK